MDKLEKAIAGLESCQKPICQIENGCPYHLTTTSKGTCTHWMEKDALELLKGFRSAIEVIEHLIEGRSKPLESESDREDMDFYHGAGTADRMDSKIAGMMIALDIIKDTLKEGEQDAVN